MPQRRRGEALGLAVGGQSAGAVAAEAGLEAVGGVVEAGVEDAGVAAAGVQAGGGFFFEEDDRGRGPAALQLAGDGEADDASADDDEVAGGDGHGLIVQLFGALDRMMGRGEGDESKLWIK